MARQVRAKARQRVLESAVRDRLAAEGSPASDKPRVSVLEELHRLVIEVVGMKDRLAEIMSDRHLDPVELAVFERALDRCGRLLVASAGLQIEERLAYLAKAEGDLLGAWLQWFVRQMATELDFDFDDNYAVIQPLIVELLAGIGDGTSAPAKSLELEGTAT